MIKLRGFRISTTEIETKIIEHVEGVKDACVIPMGHNKEGEFLCSFLVLEVGHCIDQKRLHIQLCNWLP